LYIFPGINRKRQYKTNTKSHFLMPDCTAHYKESDKGGRLV